MNRTRRASWQRGFTLVELLIAMGLLSAITAALLVVVRPTLDFAAVQPEAADAVQRSRFAWTTVRRELETAGAGSGRSALAGPLHRYFAPVLPYRLGERRADPPAGVFFRSDVITLLSVPPAGVPARVVHIAAAGASVLVTIDPNCASAPGICGFGAGNRVVVLDHAGRLFFGTVERVDERVLTIDGATVDSALDVAGGAVITAIDVAVYEVVPERDSLTPRLTRYDGGSSEMPVVDHIVSVTFSYDGDPRPPALIPDDTTAGVGPLVTYGPAPPPLEVDRSGDAWPAGENCTFAVASGARVPRLATLGPGDALVPLTAAMLTDGPWCPDADSPHRFDADLLRIRRVGMVVRVQASMPWFRGPDPALFAHPGTGRSAAWLIPDQQLRLTVTPRNLRAANER